MNPENPICNFLFPSFADNPHPMDRHTSSVELLEARIAPAGLVKISLSGGTVSITGDDLDNQITITPLSPGVLEISAVAGTQLQLGKGSPTTSPVQVTGYTKDLKVVLGRGADQVTLAAGSYLGGVLLDGGIGNNEFTYADVSIPGNFSILTKEGNDTVNATGTLRVGRSDTINLGNGLNEITSTGSEFSVGQKLTILGGNGADDFFLTATKVFVGSDAKLGPGQNIDSLTFRATDTLEIGGKLEVVGAEISSASSGNAGNAGNLANFTVGSDNLASVRGAVIFKTKNASGGFNFGGTNSTTVGGKFSAKIGASGDVTITGKELLLYGDVSISAKGGMKVTIQPATSYFLAGKFIFVGDGGVDRINMVANGVIIGGAKFDLGDGGAGQVLNFGGASGGTASVLGPLSIKQGVKTPTATSATNLARIVVGGKFSLSTGAADDTVKMDDFVIRGASSISTGGGADHLLVETLGLAGASQFVGALKAKLGDGEDRATFGVSGAGNVVAFTVASTLDAGGGTDAVEKLDPLLTVTNDEGM